MATIAPMSTLPRILATRNASSTPFLRVEKVDLEFSNGERRTFERLLPSGSGAVMIVPLLDADTVLLVREYAVGVERYELGLPKGRIEPGESVEQGALRELKEEVGYGAHRLMRLRALTLSPAYMAHRTELILAEDLYPERLPGDEPEPLEVLPWRLSELHRLIEREDVSEGRAIAALFMVRELLAGRRAP